MVHMVQICLDISWYILDISRLAAQDQNPAEIGHLAVKGCRQGLVWHITRENNVTHRKTCWTFSDVFGLFSVLYRTFSDVLSLSQFTRFALAVLLCCCALAVPSLLDASFPYLSLLSCSWFLPLFRLLFFTFITFTSHVSFPGAKKRWVLKQVLKRVGVLVFRSRFSIGSWRMPRNPGEAHADLLGGDAIYPIWRDMMRWGNGRNGLVGNWITFRQRDESLLSSSCDFAFGAERQTNCIILVISWSYLGHIDHIRWI